LKVNFQKHAFFNTLLGGFTRYEEYPHSTVVHYSVRRFFVRARLGLERKRRASKTFPKEQTATFVSV
jgi:hypothetical protein